VFEGLETLRNLQKSEGLKEFETDMDAFVEDLEVEYNQV